MIRITTGTTNTMNLFHWFNGQANLPGMTPAHDVLWSWVTISLSLAIIAGYSVIAFNWYFQSKLARHADATAALVRLRNISLSCAACGFAFFLMEIPWLVWRMYDAVLVLLVVYTWTFLIRMRGLSLVDERLAQIDAIEQAAQKYLEIAELLPHIVWTATAEGHIDFSNQQWRQYVGGREEQSWLDVVHPDEQELAYGRWRSALSFRQPLTLELRLRSDAGNYRAFLVRATPIVQGEAVKWLGACADIEDQKLLAAQQELQARQKSFFLNALSHDLRAPLHNVLLNAQLLSMTARDESDAESLRMIVDNAVAAGDLITQLLEFAKAGPQQQPQDQNTVEPVYVHAILRQVVRRFLPSAETKGLALRVTGDGDVNLTIRTDRHKLERIISNLVDNAIKYTESGGVSLALRTVGGGAGGAETDPQVAIQITDTGRGVPAENVPYLFDEFYQVNNYERDRSKGFGMGLAICRQLARHIGGDVRLASSGPQGSCFELLVKTVCPDRGGRQSGTPGDHQDPQAAGLCGV